MSNLYKIARNVATMHRVAKNVPKDKSLWDSVIKVTKGEQKSITKGDVTVDAPNDGKGFQKYPSAYANGWAVQMYEKLGGSWKVEKESGISEFQNQMRMHRYEYGNKTWEQQMMMLRGELVKAMNHDSARMAREVLGGLRRDLEALGKLGQVVPNIVKLDEVSNLYALVREARRYADPGYLGLLDPILKAIDALDMSGLDDEFYNLDFTTRPDIEE